MKSRRTPRFAGFSPEAFRFFRRLARNTSKRWSERHRGICKEHVSGTLRGLFKELVPTMLALDPLGSKG